MIKDMPWQAAGWICYSLTSCVFVHICPCLCLCICHHLMLNMQWQSASCRANLVLWPEAAKAAMIPVVVVPRFAPTLSFYCSHKVFIRMNCIQYCIDSLWWHSNAPRIMCPDLPEKWLWIRERFYSLFLGISKIWMQADQRNYSSSNSGAGVDENGDEEVLVGTFGTVWYLLWFSPREL